jgi:hypothetical protein
VSAFGVLSNYALIRKRFPPLIFVPGNLIVSSGRRKNIDGTIAIEVGGNDGLSSIGIRREYALAGEGLSV